MTMRIIILTLALLFTASAAHADFTDEYNYTQGRMTGNRSVYKDSDLGNAPNKDDGPVLGRKDRERFKDSYTVGDDDDRQRSYGRSDGELTEQQVDRKHIHWKVKRPYNPTGLGFLSPCQAQVQDEINAHTGADDEIIFTGNPRSGLAFDRFGNRYSFSCAGGNISIW